MSNTTENEKNLEVKGNSGKNKSMVFSTKQTKKSIMIWSTIRWKKKNNIEFLYEK